MFTDANYADKADDRRSASRVTVTLAQSEARWSSSTQRVTDLSSAQAEYIATGYESKEGFL